MAMLNARQMLRQRLATSTWAFGTGHGIAGLIIPELFDFLINRRDIGIPGFLEHIPLQRGQTFVLATEADAFVIRQLMGQRADFEVFGVNRGVFGLDDLGILGCLIHQCLKQGRHLGFGSRLQVQLVEFGQRIHG